MPEKTIKAKPKGLSGGGSKGLGVNQSVLDMQKKVAVKTALGPEVASQFKGMVAKTKGGPLFFTTSTYKQLSKLLGGYAVKQASKSGAWRRGQVGTIDGLLESWFSKKKNNDDSPAGQAKRSAMSWLQPKVKSELGALNGVKPVEEKLDDPAPEPEEAPPSWQKGGTGPTIGRGRGMVIGGGRGKKQPVVEEQKVETETDYTPVEPEGEGETDSTPIKAEEEKVQEEEVKDESNYVPVEMGGDIQLDDDDTDDDDLSDSSVEDIPIPAKQEQKAKAEVSKPKQLSASSSYSDTISSDSEVDELKAKIPPQKYFSLKPLATVYENEFTKGGKHLPDVYKEGIKGGPDREDIAKHLEGSWARWTRGTFDKYWDKLVALFGPPQAEDSDDDDDSKKSDSQKSGSQKSGSNKSGSKKSESMKSDSQKGVDSKDSQPSNQQSDNDTQSSQTSMDTFEREQAEEKRRAELTPALKKKETEEERAKYKLQLGGTIVQGPENQALDTGKMATNKSGPGFGIFVMASTGEMYAGSHKVGIFHHSSFLAGAKVAGAGEMKVKSGKLEMLTNKSGHYQPQHDENMQVIQELRDSGIGPKTYAFRYFDKNDQIEEFDNAEMYTKKYGYKGN